MRVQCAAVQAPCLSAHPAQPTSASTSLGAGCTQQGSCVAGLFHAGNVFRSASLLCPDDDLHTKCTFLDVPVPNDRPRACLQEAQRIMAHGIMKSEVELYKQALLDDALQLAKSVDTQPHIEMINIAIDTISNDQVFNSAVQAHAVRRSPH
jgi:hypothetical protein